MWRWRKRGPPPSRTAPIVSRAARSTASTSLPSISSAGRPIARARAEAPSPAVIAFVRVVAAKPLSSHTNSTGSSKTSAQFSPSRNGPRLIAPSPKMQQTIFFSHLSLMACAAPAAIDDVCRDDAVRAEHADLEIGDVHRAALAAAIAAFTPEQLAHHGERVGALGEGVAVAAMGREQHVVAGEVGADAGRDRLLADRGMDRPEDELLPQALERQLLEGADAPHEAVVRQEALDVEIGRDALVHLDEPPIRLSGGSLFLKLDLAETNRVNAASTRAVVRPE